MEEVLHKLEGMQSNKKRFEYLGERYPDLFIFLMTKQGMTKELKRYMDKCMTYENDWKRYTLYVRGFWLPYLRHLRKKRLLRKGKAYSYCSKILYFSKGQPLSRFLALTSHTKAGWIKTVELMDMELRRVTV